MPLDTDEGDPTGQEMIKNIVKNLRESVKICGSYLVQTVRSL
jgi:hypothetical protein